MTYQEIVQGISVTVHDPSGNWRGLLLHKIEGSYTKVLVMDADRGKGWDERTQSYLGYTVKTTTGTAWARGENRDYGKDFERHIRLITIN